MMVGALAMGSQMAGQVHDRVEVWNGSTCVEAVEVAPPGLRLRVESLGEIDYSESIEIVDDIHVNSSCAIDCINSIPQPFQSVNEKNTDFDLPSVLVSDPACQSPDRGN